MEMMDRLTVMGCLEGLTQDDWQQWYSDSEVQETAKAALSLLKEKEEMPLRCKKCSYHREDGFCSMHRIYVKETDYCSLGAWEGR